MNNNTDITDAKDTTVVDVATNTDDSTKPARTNPDLVDVSAAIEESVEEAKGTWDKHAMELADKCERGAHYAADVAGGVVLTGIHYTIKGGFWGMRKAIQAARTAQDTTVKVVDRYKERAAQKAAQRKADEDERIRREMELWTTPKESASESPA